jgi:hypothetical protein
VIDCFVERRGFIVDALSRAAIGDVVCAVGTLVSRIAEGSRRPWVAFVKDLIANQLRNFLEMRSRSILCWSRRTEIKVLSFLVNVNILVERREESGGGDFWWFNQSVDTSRSRINFI